MMTVLGMLVDHLKGSFRRRELLLCAAKGSAVVLRPGVQLSRSSVSRDVVTDAWQQCAAAELWQA